MSDFLTDAAELVRFGWKVFPLAAFSKVPAIPSCRGGRGCLDATDDADLLAEWGAEYPDANIGIACGDASRVIVVDFDPRNGSDDTVKLMASRKQFFPPTVEVRTWSGGTHLYYRWEPEIKNSKSKLGRGIDVKTTGGYVVAPPSKVRSPETGDTGQYRWVRSPLGQDLPRLPRWAAEAMKPKPEQPFARKNGDYSGDLLNVLKYVENAPKGQRNNILYWAACRAAETGAYDSKTRSSLLSAALNTGLDKAESMKTIESAYAKVGKL